MEIPISIRPAFSAAVALLESASLPTADLTAEHCEHFFFSGSPENPTGMVGLELYGEVALLRSLVVAPGRRGTGEGSALLGHAQQYALANGVRTLYLLTTTAERFFARRGYRHAPRDSAPDAIRATREYSGLCPATSTFMVRELS